MKTARGIYRLFCILTILGFVFTSWTTAHAQQNSAQKAFLVLEQNCLNCHGKHGSFTENLIIDEDGPASLIESGAVVPGVPLVSKLYTRLTTKNLAKRMPLGQPQLDEASIRAIGDWILQGAPNWVVEHDVTFINTSKILTVMQQHLQTLDPFDRPYARYFTMTHLYNAAETGEALNAYKVALAKLVNSLSWGFDIHNPQPVDAAETVFYIDVRNYEWDKQDAWSQIEDAYPYGMEFEGKPQLQAKLTRLRRLTKTQLPYVYADWFLATAVLPTLYHDILDLPGTDRELERKLDVEVQRNLQTAPGVRVWRAGMNDSGVSNHNRVVERHTSRYGAYWKSYDFAGSTGAQNVFTHPLSFQQDGGEVVFNLPNGLQAYYISDATGNRLDDAPTNIVSNPAADDPVVRNGLSCFGCHTEGVKRFEDEVRAVVRQTKNPAFDKAQAVRLYVAQAVMDRLLDEDTARYKAALEKTGGVFGGIEPVHRFYEAYQGDVDGAYAAASVGLERKTFLSKIREKSSLQRLGLTPFLNGKNVKRDVWTSRFPTVVSALHSPEREPEPVDPDPVRPNPVAGDGVYIPDANLRTAIVEALRLAPNESITVEAMKRLTHLVADRKGIRDLTGLEQAINLERIELRHNAVSDLTPLAELRNLNNIKLRDNAITDVSPLSNLINVDWMGLEENDISDVSPLSGLVKLNGIGISGNPVTDVSSLAGLTSLEGIDAWNTRISDFSALAKLPRLSWIEMGNEASISAVPSLTGLKALKRLILNNCSIRDVSGLAGLPRLEWLELVNNAITDISALRSLTSLRTLNLDANAISDVSPLAGLTNLEVLYLENNVISDVSPLAGLTKLQRLRLQSNPNLRGLSALAKLTRLEWLDLVNTDIQDISALRSLTGLQTLLLQANAISDVSPLAGLTGLKALYLEENDISDVSPLAGLKNLEQLDLRDNDISDVSPLAGLTNLKRLDLRKNDIEDFSPLDALRSQTFIQMLHTSVEGLPPMTGPWLWMIVPTLDAWGSDAAHSGKDYLAAASGGKVTELKIANNGATEGSPVGDKVWTVGELSPTGGDNLNEMANATGLGSGRIDTHVAYGSLTLKSPRVQKTTMLVGSDDSVKVWLNGTLVHNHAVIRGADDYQEQFSVTLRQGYNILLVAVYEAHGGWSGFFGFARGTDYEVIPPGTVRVAGNGPIRPVLPEETVLLHNYPNPFNPETWIPYQLSEAAEVTVRIYAANGALVRTLDVGHQPAGRYNTRTRAVHWDGKNEVGESVASGIYFYTFTARNFTATRKMLIRK